MLFLNHALGADPETLCSLCKDLEKAQSPLALEILSFVAKQRLMQAGVGDRFLPPEALPTAGAPLPEGRYSRTVAALVCAALARFDKFEAGNVLAGLLESPGPATRYCAIETLMAIDDVDVSPVIRGRFEILNKRKRDAYEMQEWELLTPSKNKLCRYDVTLLLAETDLKNDKPKEAIEYCDKIIKENPSPTLVKRATEMKQEAEKAQQADANAPH